jgi:hypothetical protein
MAEQRFCKPQVGGSIPLASSKVSGTYDLNSSLRIVFLTEQQLQAYFTFPKLMM